MDEESEAIKSAEEVTELGKMNKKMLSHVQNELNEHNEALQHFLEVKDGGKGGQNSRRRQQKGKRNRDTIEGGGVGGHKDHYGSDDTDTEERESSGSRNSRKESGNRRKKGKRSRKGDDKSQGGSNFNIKNGMVWNYDGPNHDQNDSSRVQLDILKDPRYFHFSNDFGVGFTEDGGVSFPKVSDFKFDD